MAETSGMIVRRVRKIHKGKHHGGAWKIALADFALAMMAFFMVLWIMSVASPEELAAIQGYFNDPKGMATAGYSNVPIDLGGSPAKSDQAKLDLDLPEPGSVKDPEDSDSEETAKAEKEKKELVETIGSKMQEINILQSVESNLKIDVTPDGVRITLLDDKDNPMFSQGSGQLLPEFESVLVNIGEIISHIKNHVVITGHTDSTSYGSGSGLIGNWELSSMRANESRRLLEEGGVPTKQIAQVTGLADSVPYNKEDPTSPENRRISLVILTDSAYEKMLERNRTSFSNNARSTVEPEPTELKPEDVF